MTPDWLATVTEEVEALREEIAWDLQCEIEEILDGVREGISSYFGLATADAGSEDPNEILLQVQYASHLQVCAYAAERIEAIEA